VLLATWRSGYAAACKAVYTGSIPVVASVGTACKKALLGYRLRDLGLLDDTQVPRRLANVGTIGTHVGAVLTIWGIPQAGQLGRSTDLSTEGRRCLRSFPPEARLRLAQEPIRWPGVGRARWRERVRRRAFAQRLRIFRQTVKVRGTGANQAAEDRCRS
jgi:hypothetical protein